MPTNTLTDAMCKCAAPEQAGARSDTPEAGMKDPVIAEFEARMAQCKQCMTLKLGVVLAVAVAAAAAALVKLL